MKTIMIKLTNCLAAVSLCVAMCLSAVSCQKDELTDGNKFALFYKGITDIGPSTNMDLTPSYHGAPGSAFSIYRVTLDGVDYETTSFSIEPDNGQVHLRDTENLPVGLYALSIQCTSAGKVYQFPDLITVNMMRPVPEGITMVPSEIAVPLADVTNLNLTEALPSAQITTDGNHISIKGYQIAKVMRDGKLLEDWSGLFEIDNTGKVSILRNQEFLAGIYVLDFKLLTHVAGAESELGIYEGALTVDVQAPPTSLVYSPSSVAVQFDYEYVSRVPRMVGSSNGLKYSISSVSPQGAPVTIDEKTGVITLSTQHELPVGTEVLISVLVENALGSMDFAQVLKVTLVENIAPITVLEYNDSTVWHNTKYSIKPTEIDGDEKIFSFVNLPEELSALKIDELTGAISAKKGNGIAVGEYNVKVSVENSKGSMTKDIKLTVIENPYFFTYVHWGNNLGLTPADKYASQHRVSMPATEPLKIAVFAKDAKADVELAYEIKGGSKTNYASIHEKTGEITVDPSVFTSVKEMRTHFIFVSVTSGKGTSGETTVKIPVFFDFNHPRAADGYQIKYTPFVFQCNPKNGGVSAVPEITQADGSALTAVELANITMDFRRSFNYWNLNGPETHISGEQNKAEGCFLNIISTAYYTAAGVKVELGSRKSFTAYDQTGHMDKKPAYVRETDLAVYVAPDKWKTADGYADGIFTGQITFADSGTDPQGAADPYRLFPLFVWFDTEF